MKKLALLFSIVILASGICFAQATGFTYQGKLGDAGAPANGNYDFQFKLFDQATGGTQQGSTLTNTGPTNTGLTVVNGGFTVQLDFGANFPGGANGDRYLETSVRLHSADPNSPAYSTLSPRQQIRSTPYAIRSLAAATADNVSGVVSVANGGTGSATQNFVDLTSNQTIGGNKTFSGTLSGNVVQAATQYIFGDGSDGDVTFTTAQTLTRDVYYHNLTISDFMSLNPGGYRIFVSGTLTLGLGASIARNGNDSFVNAAVALAPGTLGGSGGAGQSESNRLGGRGGNGTVVPGGFGSGIPTSVGGVGVFRLALQALSGRSLDGVIVNGGGGGGGGSFSGQGGGGGGVVVVSARTVVLSLGSATITAVGGGGNSTGGGGGGGGVVVVITTTPQPGGLTLSASGGGGFGGGANGAAGFTAWLN